ncbi:toxin HipA [Advenella kashmirensis W13003]|uniref:Toxin HipA n=2 Tax=Advenella kashmirensis TaxID=310575 RepID=V8QU21_9BURK|nr:toxin HipA [Advenella kashmirensis W13003]
MIGVYADWEGLSGPKRLGWLHSRKTRQTEIFEFEYDAEALADAELTRIQIDPQLTVFPGPQYPGRSSDRFGVFADSSPDRWGRMLMDRRHERDIRSGLLPNGTRLFESDYLLGVHDHYRVGALRYKLDDIGPFLDNRDDAAAPPFTKLAELETASRSLEKDTTNRAIDGQQWIRMLIAPGGSLGGARPKASVVDGHGHLYIAKFPSLRDEYDVGAWEIVVNGLANACGLNVAQCDARKFASRYHCCLVRRFDRTTEGHRLHFASAMTLTDHVDGDNAESGVSYLEIAELIMARSVQPDLDLRELWSRIVFNILVSNTDDHLRNHGFILEPGRGWRLSPAYDMNPVTYADGLCLNITEADNALDLDLALEVAEYFRLSGNEAHSIIEDFRHIVGQWPVLAKKLGLSDGECERMADAFHLAAT